MQNKGVTVNRKYIHMYMGIPFRSAFLLLAEILHPCMFIHIIYIKIYLLFLKATPPPTVKSNINSYVIFRLNYIRLLRQKVIFSSMYTNIPSIMTTGWLHNVSLIPNVIFLFV